VRNLDEQMNLFEHVDPVEIPDLDTPPFSPELLAKSKERVEKAPLDILEGSVTAPVVAAGDAVDIGAMLPPLADEQMMIPGAVQYSAIEQLFETLSNQGVSRESAVKLINENTPINLEGSPAEFIGEMAGVTASGVTKAATGLAKIASKYGDEAGKYLSEIGDELGDMFRAATPGGDDFDGMAPATVSTGTTIKTSTDFERPSVFRIFGGTQGRTANTRIKKAEEAEKVDSDPEYVFKESSVFRGEDKKIRYEIATKDVELLPYFKKQGKVDDHPIIKDDKGNVVQEQMYQVFEDPSMKRKIVLADIIKFDELFKEYPHLKGIPVRRLGNEATEDGTRALYDPFDRVIYTADAEEEEFISSLLHEIQHAVDHFEGRQYGASPTMFKTDAMREATSKLDQLGGERNNFFHFITNKETSENFEKYTPDELDTLRSNEFQLLMSSVYSDRYINDEAFDHFRKEFDPIIAKFADWEKRDFQKLVQLRNEYDILEKQANIDEKEAFRKYRSAGGEVDARNVQIRRSKPETQLNVLPSETADMPKDLDLVDKFGKPVSLPEKSPLRVLFDETVDTMTAAGVTADDVAAWRKTNETSEEFRKSLKGRSETLKALAAGVRDGVVTRAEYREAADAIRPIRNVQDVPRPATAKEIVSALGGREGGRGILGLNRNIPDGAEIDARLDINAYTNFDVWIPTLKHEGKTLYSPSVSLKDVTFIQPDSPPVGKALKVATGAEKAPFAVMKGKYNQMSDDAAFEYAQQIFDSDEWIQVGYDPTRRGYFYNRADGAPVLSAEEVVQIGHLVLAKKAQKGNPEDFAFNKGGVVPMKEQMEMFEDGGLMDEGGTVDPVSGNDVPPGSTQEEVRDDIPAQLSEGEFVFPADVVRYIGLGNLMRMRQEAKLGLRLMDEMGQMGNSDEASMPDDMPFDINDLDMEDEPEYNVGGFVPGTAQQQQFGITGFQQAPVQTMGAATQPVQAASQQFVPQPITRPAQAYVPVQQVPTPLPTFGEITGPGVPEVDYEFATFRNEAGQEIQLKIKKGSQGELLPGEVLPDGYSWVDPTATETEEVTTTPTTVQTEQVLSQEDLRDRDDADAARRQADIDRYGTADNKIGLMDFYGPGKDLIYGVNYVDGFGMGLMGVGQVLKGTVGGGKFPDGAMIMLKNGDDEILLTGEQYTRFRNVVRAEGTDYSDILDLMEEGRIESAKAKAAKVKKEEKRQSVANIISGTEDDDGGYKGTGESYDISQKGAGLESSLKGSSTPGGTGGKVREDTAGSGVGRQDYSGGFREDSDDDNQTSGGTPSQDFSASSSSNDSNPFSGYSMYRAKGGLASKPKSKAKKMKRGGLASKK